MCRRIKEIKICDDDDKQLYYLAWGSYDDLIELNRVLDDYASNPMNFFSEIDVDNKSCSQMIKNIKEECKALPGVYHVKVIDREGQNFKTLRFYG